MPVPRPRRQPVHQVELEAELLREAAPAGRLQQVGGEHDHVVARRTRFAREAVECAALASARRAEDPRREPGLIPAPARITRNESGLAEPREAG